MNKSRFFVKNANFLIPEFVQFHFNRVLIGAHGWCPNVMVSVRRIADLRKKSVRNSATVAGVSVMEGKEAGTGCLFLAFAVRRD